MMTTKQADKLIAGDIVKLSDSNKKRTVVSIKPTDERFYSELELSDGQKFTIHNFTIVKLFPESTTSRIAALQQENERLREALQGCQYAIQCVIDRDYEISMLDENHHILLIIHNKAAVEALNGLTQLNEKQA